MIAGIGSDIVDIRRIAALLERFPQRFITRHFTAGEIAAAQALNKQSPASLAAYYATRFAAKEACAKALGCGIGAFVGWHDIETLRLPNSPPALHLTSGALRYISQAKKSTHPIHAHVSLSDEFPYAQAFVVLEFRPA